MQPLLREINLTEARRRLSGLLREIERDPDIGYQIKVRDRVVAELRSPAGVAGRLSSGAALLELASDIEVLHPRKPGQRLRNIAGNYKEQVYGRKPRTRNENQ